MPLIVCEEEQRFPCVFVGPSMFVTKGVDGGEGKQSKEAAATRASFDVARARLLARRAAAGAAIRCPNSQSSRTSRCRRRRHCCLQLANQL